MHDNNVSSGVSNNFWQWRIQGAVWGNCPPSDVWGAPMKGAFNVNTPLFGACRNRNKDKNYSKLKNALQFVGLQDLRAGHLPSFYYRTVSTMLFFRKNASVPLFLSHMRTANLRLGNHKRSCFRRHSSTCRWAPQNWSVLVTSLFF